MTNQFIEVINDKKDTKEKPILPPSDSENNQTDLFQLFTNQLDTTSTEYREICKRFFGYSATPQEVFTASKSKHQEIDSKLKRLTIYDPSLTSKHSQIVRQLAVKSAVKHYGGHHSQLCTNARKQKV